MIGRTLAVAGVALACMQASAYDRALPLASLRSGITFAGPDVQSMQADDFANPGMLWVERGEKLWNEAPGPASKSCSGCHGDAMASMKGVAARYPAVDATTGKLLDLEERVNACRVSHQKASPWRRESEELLAATAFVAYQSRGMPAAVTIDDAARVPFERGRAFYYARHGQMNLSCAQCHEQNWGKQLLRETISQGHGNGFPAYRLEWQSVGSLQRRLRACLFGIRAEMPAPGSPELLELELFLAWRAQDLPLEAPAVRR